MHKPIPTLYIDEHVHPPVIRAINEMPWKYKIVYIAKTRRLAGRDERDFAHELRAQNGILITCDREYATDILNKDLPCPCVILLPAEDIEEAKAEIPIIFGRLQYYIEKHGIRSLRDTVFHCTHDGLRYVKHGRNVLEASTESVRLDIEEYIYKDLKKIVKLGD